MVTSFDKRLRRILVKRELLEENKAGEFIEEADKEQKFLTDILVEKRAIDERELLGVVGQSMNIQPVDLSRIMPSEDALECLPQDMARYYCMLPLSKVGKVVTVAVPNPFDILRLDDARVVTGCDIRPMFSTARSIKLAISRAYNPNKNRMEELIDDIRSHAGETDVRVASRTDEIIDLAEEAARAEGSHVVKFVNLIIYQAVKSGVSDIHIEPYEKDVRVRYRVDGRCVAAPAPPKQLINAVVSRIKIMASLDIAEKRVPQDGKFQVKVEGRQVDFRVSVLPVVHGEKVVLRILDVSNLALQLDDLGFEEKALKDFKKALEQPYGMLLVTGPTGSGKSTTLYSAIKEVMTPEENIVTVEDPVEYQLKGVNQVPVNVKRGLTFAGALRSILRQDPDTIMIGEVRDLETAEIAIKAALTGHLVLSTLHTNDAASSMTRLVDMGVEPFMVASSLLLVVAQRLGRKVCEHCREPYLEPPPPAALMEVGFTEQEAKNPIIYQAKGCSRCTRGYRGRFALLETIVVDEEIQRIVLKGGTAVDIKNYAIEHQGMVSLRRVGILNILRGKTTVEEVLSVTREGI